MRAAAPRCRCAQITGKPILFVGTGEKSEALELFQPERIASRILGMGDVLSLVEQVQGPGRSRKGREARQEDRQGQILRSHRIYAIS